MFTTITKLCSSSFVSVAHQSPNTAPPPRYAVSAGTCHVPLLQLIRGQILHGLRWQARSDPNTG